MSNKDKKGSLKIGQLANLFEWLVIAVLVFTSASLVLSNFDNPLKLRVFSVMSGSMEPSIRLGSMVFVRPQPQYYENDIITFADRNDPKRTTTHRIVRISEEPDLGYTSFVTKGDANEDNDAGFVRDDRVLGKVFLKIPSLGYLVAFAKTQMGFTFMVVMPATILIYSEANNIRREVKAILDERKEKKKEKEKKKKKNAPKKKTVKKSKKKAPKKK